MPGGYLSAQQLEEEGVVYRLKGLLVLDGELELRGVVLAGDGLQPDARGCGRGHDVVQQAGRVHQRAGSVAMRTRGVPLLPAPLSVRLKHVGLQLDPDSGPVPGGFEVIDRLGQRVPRRDGERLVVLD